MDGCWWYKGERLNLGPRETHIDFFINNPEKLGFTEEEKDRLLVKYGFAEGTDYVPDVSKERDDILLEVLARGAIRERDYRDKRSIQIYDYANAKNRKELLNLILDKKIEGYYIALDTKGWGMYVNSYIDPNSEKKLVEALMNSVRKEKKNLIKSDMNEEQKNNLIETLKEQGYSDDEAEEIAAISIGANAVSDNNGGSGYMMSHRNNRIRLVKSSTGESQGRVLEGEEKNAVLTEVLRQQGYSDSDIALMLGQSRKSVNSAKSSKKTIKSAKIYREMSFRDFEPWSGAKSTYDVIIGEGKEDEMDAMLDEMYPDGLSDTELNDLLWFDADSVFEWLGIESGESGLPEGYEYEEDESSSYSRARKSDNKGLFESRKVTKRR